ncbi:hypothetical protein K2173_011813 [Erythroxylum novogranatense]|uniref:KANL2-like probable zinc-finger domain-containing protein n=1 Tax=Erythroxylum novogranatense TaxID=1862640 RepID=A0AAV8SMA8_9ROSI|nr:hypothetical protein K2173_011813 [Erythroxylum novogranatense]
MQQQASPLPKSMADPANAQPMSIDGSAQDSLLSSSSYLTRHEVLTRRSRRLKQLSRIYTSHYWALMEDLKSKYRDYYWKYGKSPFRQDHKKSRDFGVSHPNLGLQDHEQGLSKCAVAGCKSKAMPLTKFCHPHILSDSKQKLYTACSFVLKSAQGRPVLCGKPILRSTVPALCPPHFQKAETYLARALKKAGLNVFSTTKLAPKFHVIVAEFVRQIQHRRRSAQKENAAKV